MIADLSLSPIGMQEPNLSSSSDLRTYSEYSFAAEAYISSAGLQTSAKQSVSIAAASNRGIIAAVADSFKNDYYNRIHVFPQTLNLGTIASQQTRNLTLWNAYLDQTATIDNILISEGNLVIQGPSTPYEMQPLQEQIYSVVIGVSGPPGLDASVLFHFSDHTSPLPVRITGTRAIKFDIMPELPVKETWSWLTDKQVAKDGTEMRAALRGAMPRIEVSLKVIADKEEIIRSIHTAMLTCFGRLWIPEYQYGTYLTSASAVGSNSITFDNNATDIRAGDYVMLLPASGALLVQVLAVTATGCTLAAPLTVAIPAGCILTPGSTVVIGDTPSMNREAVNDYATMSLTCQYTRDRTTLVRSAVNMTTFKGRPVLERRPMANDTPDDTFYMGTTKQDGDIGKVDVVSNWDYARVGGTRVFRTERMLNPTDMDYWKTFFDYCRGQCKVFWMPTYRTDLALVEVPTDGSSALKIAGEDYGVSIFALPTHRYLELQTLGGIVRLTVTSATVQNGVTIAAINPALPSGAAYTTISRISYLLPMRLSDDKVEFEHRATDSIITVSVRTAEVT